MGFEPTTPTLARLETLFPCVPRSFLDVPNPLSRTRFIHTLSPDVSADCRFGDDRVVTEEDVVTNRDRVQKLTKREVVGARPAKYRYTVWDTEVRGFGVRVEPSGRKTFIARYRVGGGRTGIQRQATIGRYGTITPDQARKER